MMKISLFNQNVKCVNSHVKKVNKAVYRERGTLNKNPISSLETNTIFHFQCIGYVNSREQVRIAQQSMTFFKF